jgi:alpha-galactosidase
VPHRFTPLASVPVDIARARVHVEGWQSWSPSDAYALGEKPHRPVNDYGGDCNPEQWPEP